MTAATTDIIMTEYPSKPTYSAEDDCPPDMQPAHEPGSLLPTKVEPIANAQMAKVEVSTKPAITANQAKIEAIADLTKNAYARASELKLTGDEIEALQEEFPDEAFKPGAAGKESLIYVEHAFLRDRLNAVFGPGQWSIIPRSRWTEKFQYYDKYTKSYQEAAIVYVEAMLLIRGCFVAEAIGDMTYYPKNQQTNFGDAVEGAKTAALRRCCKELGVGLQAWKKDWCEGWWARRRASKRPQDASGSSDTQPEAKNAPEKQPDAGKGDSDETRHYPMAEILMVAEKSGKTTSGRAWKAWFLKVNAAGMEFEVGTFSQTLGELAGQLSNESVPASITIKPGKRAGTWELVSIDRADGHEAPVQEVVP